MLYWLLLWIIWTFFEEINNSITKHKSQKHHFLMLWVITSFFGMVIFICFWIYKYYFTEISINFNPKSIPLLLIRLLFEILQSYFTMLAIQKADRTTFSTIRILTIPLLIISDIILWYHFTIYSLIWMWIILLSFILFNLKSKTINFKWWELVLFTAVNAVITISIYKYSITHFWNSVEVDQFFIFLWLLSFFIIYNYKKNKSCALKLILKEKQFILQWLAIWFASLILSYSYLYLNSSEATMIKRAWEMFWSISTWYLFFNETSPLRKILLAIMIVIWLAIMII